MKEMKHGEALKLMWYACECGHRERIWNSRDGVTPFMTSCPSCGKLSLTHVDWGLDEPTWGYTPHLQQRFWRDGTKEEAMQILARRFDKAREKGHPVPEDVKRSIMDKVGEWDSEFREGWPKLDRRIE